MKPRTITYLLAIVVSMSVAMSCNAGQTKKMTDQSKTFQFIESAPTIQGLDLTIVNDELPKTFQEIKYEICFGIQNSTYRITNKEYFNRSDPGRIEANYYFFIEQKKQFTLKIITIDLPKGYRSGYLYHPNKTC